MIDPSSEVNNVFYILACSNPISIGTKSHVIVENVMQLFSLRYNFCYNPFWHLN